MLKALNHHLSDIHSLHQHCTYYEKHSQIKIAKTNTLVLSALLL
jgi:hypothetical protein